MKVEVWYEFLKDFPFERALNNLRHHVDYMKYPPTIAEIKMLPKPEEQLVPRIQYYKVDENDEIMQDLRRLNERYADD